MKKNKKKNKKNNNKKKNNKKKKNTTNNNNNNDNNDNNNNKKKKKKNIFFATPAAQWPQWPVSSAKVTPSDRNDTYGQEPYATRALSEGQAPRGQTHCQGTKGSRVQYISS